MKKSLFIAIILAMAVCSVMAFNASSAQAGMVLWYGKKPTHGNWWWQRDKHTPNRVPTYVQSKLKQGYIVYWVFCRDNQCNSALRAVQKYHDSHRGELPDWRHQTK